jgi:thiol-disulfide isomerase/thioredoxin
MRNASPGPPVRASTFNVVRRLLAIVAAALLVACSSGGNGGRAGRPLDANFKRFDGTTGTLAEYRGKPVVMNFFSSTCIPCQTEMPALETVHRTLGDQVTFLGMDVQDTVEGGRAFVDTVGITWELGRDPDAAILQGALGGVGLPTTVVLDRTGVVVFSHLGPLDVAGLTKTLRDNKLIS